MTDQPKSNSSIFKKLFHCHKFESNKNDGSPESTLLGTSYAEQYLTVEQLSEVYSDSFIDPINPEKSDGLTNAEAEKRLQDGGPNSIPSSHQNSTIKLFLKQFLHKFWILLLIAAILCFITYGTNKYFGRLGNLNLYCGIILVTVVIFMSILSFWEQKKALNIVNNFKHLIPEKSYIIRDCIERYIDSENIVVGDIVVISSGKVIPADMRILRANGLKIDSAVITGLKQAVDYISDPVPRNIDVFHARNIAFKDSYCVEGDGIGIVIRIGPYTALGHLSGIKKHIQLKQSRLQKDIKYFTHFLSLLTVVLALIIIVVGIIVANMEHILYHFSTGFVIVVVACIPQGLPALVMSQHSIIARKLAKNNVYIKKADIIDKLGAVTVMCIDKTGILTENRLEVNGIWSDRKHIGVAPPEKQQKKLSILEVDGFNTEIKQQSKTVNSPLMTVMTVCNNAQFDHVNGISTRVSTRQALQKWQQEHSGIKNLTKTFTVVDSEGHSNRLDPTDIAKLEDGYKTDAEHDHLDSDIIGGPVDAALLKYADKQTDIEDIRNSFPKLMEIPFNSIRRWQMTISRCQRPPKGADLELLPEMEADDVVNVVMIKGDPVAILRKCKYYSFNGKLSEIDEDFENECREKWEEYGIHGARVIAFAIKHFISKAKDDFSISSNNYPIDDLVFLGMTSMIDPPKEDAKMAMKGLKEAGIKIIMVTGDPASSVLAMAKEIGLISKDETVAMIGKPEIQQSKWTIKTGDNLSIYSESDWDKVFQHQVVLFAHVNPTQKLQIIQEAQKRKETVAFSSINTVSAIAAADIGIALADSSTDLAQDAAGIILTDNNFTSILKGIEQGRLMFDNLCLSIAYTLTHLLPEICPIFLTFAFEMPLALQPLQILFIDLITDFISSISLIWENPESDVMKIPPRNRKKRLVPGSLLLYAYGFAGIAITLGCFGAYLSVFWYYGILLTDITLTSEDYWDYSSPNLTIASSEKIFDANEQVYIRQQASAAWQGTLILAQIFHLLLCKTRRISLFQHKMSLLITIGVIVLQLLLLWLLIYIPPLQYILEIQPPPTHAWIFAPICLLNKKTQLLYSESDWDKVFQHQIILFAHVNPTQKLQIIQEAQKRKETVAFSSINTVSAIAAADIGIALADSSTDLAQDAAGIILTDNNFASILKGIEQGRLMFDNLCLSIAYTLTHLLPEICPIFLTFAFEMPLALQPLQILFIDLITDFISSISLIWENPESDVMKIPPRNRKKRLVPGSLLLYAYGFAGIAITLGCFGAYLSVFWYYGIMLTDLTLTSEDYWDYSSPNLTIASSGNVFDGNEQIYIRQQASSAWQGTLILAQIFHLLLCKTRRISLFQHKMSLLITVGVVILQLLLLWLSIYAPPLQYILEIQPPPTHAWIFAPIIGIYLLLFNEGRKYLARKWPNNKILKIIEF